MQTKKQNIDTIWEAYSFGYALGSHKSIYFSL